MAADERAAESLCPSEVRDGKEGVRGSSPRGGFASFLRSAVFVVDRGEENELRRPPSVHAPLNPPLGPPRIAVAERVCAASGRRPRSVHRPLERVHQRDGMLAAIPRKVAVVAVDHRDARTDEATPQTQARPAGRPAVSVGKWSVVDAPVTRQPGQAPSGRRQERCRSAARRHPYRGGRAGTRQSSARRRPRRGRPSGSCRARSRRAASGSGS